MPTQTKIWTVNQTPQILEEASLESEQQLEEMITQEPKILSDDWMLIGRQEKTTTGGVIDLLAIAPDGSLVLIELKRDRTPRDVVSQALDYASWVETLSAETITGIFETFSSGKSLTEAFQDKYGQTIHEESINQSHQIIIVAAELDSSTERIVTYLSDRNIPINVLFFQVFSHGDQQFLSRTWLFDPVETQSSASASNSERAEPWNGEFYCSFGHGNTRSWPEAVRHGFISGGGGAWYSRTLQLLSPDDRVWVKVPGSGFVGVGMVTGQAQPIADFNIETDEGITPILDVLSSGHYHLELKDNKDDCEYFVPVKWLDTKSLENAVQEVGMFGNQNTVCKPTTKKWQSTVEKLKKYFPGFNQQVK